MKTKCMSCGGSMKKMAVGGTTTKRIIKKSTGGMYGIPQENLGTSGQYGFAQKGGGVTSGIAKKIINTAKKSNPNIQNLYDKNGNKKSKAQFILQQMKTDLKNKTVKKYQRGGVTKADPYGVLNEKKRYDKSGGNMVPTKIFRKKVDPMAPKPSSKRTVERNGTFALPPLEKAGATKKMQNGGLTNGAKKVQKQGPIKTIKTIKNVLKKLTPRKTTPGCFGAGCSKMQNGGMIPRCPGPNCPKRPITGPIKAIKKVVKKITRPLRKAQNGIEMDDNMMINKPGYSGGYSKGAVSKEGAVSEVPVTPVRPRIDSGPIPAPDYNSSPGKSGRDSYERRKPSGRPSMGKPTMENWLEAKKKYGYVEPTSKEKPVSDYYKKGGATKAAKFAALAPPYNKATFADKIVGAKKSAGSKKLPKAQLGAIVKGVVKYGSKGIKIGARAAQKNKALTMQAKRLSNLEKVAPGSKRKLMDKVMLNKVSNSERIQIANLFDRISKVERTRAFNKDLKKVGLVSGGVMGALGLAAKYVNDSGKYISDKVKNIYGVDKKKKKK